MDPEERSIREALIVRANRSDPITISAELREVTSLSQDRPVDALLRRAMGPIRATATTAAVLIAAGAIAIVALRPLAGGAPAAPVGLYQSQRPVGTGAIGAETCVAVQLDDAAYRSGGVTVWWWLVGGASCHSSASGPMAAVAQIEAVQLHGSGGLPSRIGYRVEFVLQLLPSGSERVSFTLDPGQGPAGSTSIAASAGDGAGGVQNTFDRVTKLAVTEPGGGSIPTPGAP